MTGWRWESYQTVEVQVPDDWRYDSIAVGRYSLGHRSSPARAPLIASSTLTGDAAKALVAAIGAAPEGLDPDVPDCIIVYGGELIVLTMHAGDRTQEVLVRYAGCRFNGTDDGTTQRRLTAAVVRPLLTGVHQQTSYNNGLYELVFGHAGVSKPTSQ
ncbi:hypothetical protein BWI15_27180 [Kribbella sp. ALI-6-A]|uniref:hypothetical protein n=1 Tax=Kribbella sp. ALI-6-A TaxID=1933817 RepID=UPI00097C114D|nr:hypothetical protein [Kribbella sp. ALI-6-A]ONI66875.1 hypothetical protein BWI15_27180 [Kribbella sp. ALI-6-A]